ncbi:flagellar hook-length control protein FliK [Grimontia hollisae]|uniref:flagellar hook-length control protein FliK n=1 Tax=Grimontia hollisae TaxID=673 RepID=UPI0023DBC261|nr:flagellar hook-length control protein FliK [Grimontia hollisae]MDF2183802.1 flagellar hook-length control protein FliK [Grimontia hollisae]
MQISVTATNAATVPSAGGKTISARPAVTGGQTGNAATPVNYHAQASELAAQNGAAQGAELSHSAEQQPSAPTTVLPGSVPQGEGALEQSPASDTLWQASELDALSAALDTVFPALAAPQCEQIAQWIVNLQHGGITPEALVATLNTQLKANGVSVPPPALATLESLFGQVADGALPVSELTQALTALGQLSRQGVLDGVGKPFSESLPAQAQKLLHLQPQGQTHVQTTAMADAAVRADRADIAPLLREMSGDRAAQPLNALPVSDLAVTMNEAAPERLLAPGLAPQPSPQTSPAIMVPGASPATAAQQLDASVDISQPEWGRELVDQLRARLRFNQQDAVQTAHVRLDPPELGKLEITLRVEGDKVNVHIAAAHPQLREALLTHADRLRFDIEQSQLQLANVSVSSGSQQQGHDQSQGGQQEHRAVKGNPMKESSPFSTPSMSDLGRYASVV